MKLSTCHLLASIALGATVNAAPHVERRSCTRDGCLNAILDVGSLGTAFCKTYESLPPKIQDLPVWIGPCFGSSARLSSACSCVYTAPSTSKLSTSTSKASSSASTTAHSVAPTSTSTSTLQVPSSTSTTSSSTSSAVISSTSLTSSAVTETPTSSSSSTPTSSSATSTTSSTSTTSASSSSSDVSTSSSSSITSTSSSSAAPSTSSSSISPVVSSISSSSTGTSCTATVYSMIAPAVAACTNIVLQDIYAPPNSAIDLSKLKQGSTVTFAGTTTFGFTNSSTFNPITLGGKGVTVQGAPGSIIDGNGQAYWDGQGSNGGAPKPDHFVVVSKMTLNSVIKNLNIQNYPTHCFSISGCADLTITNISLDNTAGNAPNDRSNGLPAAHNTDGFDIATCNRTTLTASTVYNQDDCVAVTSGDTITVSNMYCSGGHGISIGSVGGKSNNNVTNVLFTDSTITNSENGARIKSNYGTTGFIANITYSNIQLNNISTFGIDVQQDYLNGGATGNPSNGVIMQNFLFENITGSATSSARDYYILCGDGSCSNFVFTDVDVVGGGQTSTCNYPPTGCPGP